MALQKTLYLSDLDGTLLNGEAKFTAKTIDIMTRLLKKGLFFSLASARSNVSMMQLLKEIPLVLPLIVMNGCMLYDPVAKKLLHIEGFQQDQAKRIIELMQEKNCHPFLYSLTGVQEQRIYYTALDNEMIRAHFQTRISGGDPRFRKVSSLKLPENEQPFYFMTLGPEEEMRPLSNHLIENQIAHHFYPDTYTGGYLLECSAPGADKGTAALRLKKMLGAERLVVFGDNLNDLSMFSVADEAYAVSDAHESLKEAATGVIGASYEDGVALFLEKTFS